MDASDISWYFDERERETFGYVLYRQIVLWANASDALQKCVIKSKRRGFITAYNISGGPAKRAMRLWFTFQQIANPKPRPIFYLPRVCAKTFTFPIKHSHHQHLAAPSSISESCQIPTNHSHLAWLTRMKIEPSMLLLDPRKAPQAPGMQPKLQLLRSPRLSSASRPYYMCSESLFLEVVHSKSHPWNLQKVSKRQTSRKSQPIHKFYKTFS